MHHRFTENIATISENVAEDPKVSIPRRCQKLGLSYLYLRLHPYNVKIAQQLKSAEQLQRRRYLEWVLEQ